MVLLEGREWTDEERRKALYRGQHQSTIAHVPFMREEFTSMMGKGQCVVMLY